MDIHNYLEEIRTLKQVPMEVIINETGLTRRRVYNFFYGEGRPKKKEVAEPIADALGLPAGSNAEMRVAAFYRDVLMTQLGPAGKEFWGDYKRMTAAEQKFLRLTAKMLSVMPELLKYDLKNIADLMEKG